MGNGSDLELPTSDTGDRRVRKDGGMSATEDTVPRTREE